MGFKQEYSVYLGSTEADKNCTKSSILTFFGYRYNVENQSSLKTHGGDYFYNSSKNAIQQTATVLVSDSHYYQVFYRFRGPSGRLAELESQFCHLFKGDLTDSHSLYTSVQKHYEVLGDSPLRTFLTVFTRIICASYVLLFLFAHMTGHTDTMPEFERGLASLLFLICLAFFFLCGLFFLEWIKPKKWGKLSRKQKEAWRTKYLNDITRWYPGKVGEILKEYAILQGYDAI